MRAPQRIGFADLGPRLVGGDTGATPRGARDARDARDALARDARDALARDARDALAGLLGCICGGVDPIHKNNRPKIDRAII